MNNDSPSPWYRQRWLWFVISFPLIAVIAGIITYRIAAENPHNMVQDDYFKKGLAINQSLARLAEARKRGIVANLVIDRDNQLIIVKLSSIQAETEQSASNQLLLTFSHPTQAKLDRSLTLYQLTEQEFAAQLPDIASANWHVRLSSHTEKWLIKSRWLFPEIEQLEISAISSSQ